MMGVTTTAEVSGWLSLQISWTGRWSPMVAADVQGGPGDRSWAARLHGNMDCGDVLHLSVDPHVAI